MHFFRYRSTVRLLAFSVSLCICDEANIHASGCASLERCDGKQISFRALFFGFSPFSMSQAILMDYNVSELPPNFFFTSLHSHSFTVAFSFVSIFSHRQPFYYPVHINFGWFVWVRFFLLILINFTRGNLACFPIKVHVRPIAEVLASWHLDDFGALSNVLRKGFGRFMLSCRKFNEFW